MTAESPTEDDMQIAAACDEKYAMPLAVMLASVNANLGAGRRVVAHVLESGLSAATREKIESSMRGGRIAIRWIVVEPERLVRYRDTLRSYDTVSIASYYRLLLPEVLPDDLERVIYLDCDLVVNRDLRHLWTVDIGNTCLGAVPELLGMARYASAPAGIRLHRELGLPPDLELFNSGVMLINLVRWRDERVASRAVTYLREAAPYVRWHDQEALNVSVAGDWTRLDPRWNVTMHVFRGRQDATTLALARDAYIVHYNSAIKPWAADFRLAGRELFLRYLDETAWRGWRPEERRKTLLRRSIALLVRAGQKRRHRVAHHLQVAHARYRGWRALRKRVTQVGGSDVPVTRAIEIRVFICGAEARSTDEAVRHYLALGADRVLLAVDAPPGRMERVTDWPHDRVHLFLRHASDDRRRETLRPLLHRHGQGHWCVVVNHDERFVPAQGLSRLTDLRIYLEQGGYGALVCELSADDASAGLQAACTRMQITMSDPIKNRVFCVDARARTSGRRVTELECRSRIFMLRYSDDLVLDREFRGVQGARVSGLEGILARVPT